MAGPSKAVLAARARREAAAPGNEAQTEWYIKEVLGKITLSMDKRIKLATEYLRSSVVRNLSMPVTKSVGPRGGIIVTDRSKPGEYPRADTTLLLKTIFSVTEKIEGDWEGHVGTPLDYGLSLETRMNRSFLVRTLNEKKGQITAILTGPIV